MEASWNHQRCDQGKCSCTEGERSGDSGGMDFVNNVNDILTCLCQADMNDRESLKKAVEGSYAVFAVTNCQLASSMRIVL